ncbi:MAG: methionyl-tRNA formyltransferase [Ectothiorhodospiraceae bacterium]|nr:methionyl-tRNA formyltransferase [Ectothiorhodospiraceae bacterium]
MAEPSRLVFAGTPEFAVPALDALIQCGHPPVAVYTQPDRPAGRGRQLRASPVKQRALEAGIPVYQPTSLRDAEAQTELAALRPRLMIVVAYGLLLPQTVLETPALGCVNIHASLLPRWRGAAPIQRAVLAGDRETGVCLMQMERGLDTGPVLARAVTPIHPEDTGGTLHDRLAAMGGSLLAERLAELLAGTLVPQPQDNALATYASKLDKAEARLDWSRPAARLQRQVAAFNPWPVAETVWRGQTLRVWKARVIPGAVEPGGQPPGTVLVATKQGVDVATGDGVLRLLELQPPGKRPMAVDAFLNSRPLEPGEHLA